MAQQHSQEEIFPELTGFHDDDDAAFRLQLLAPVFSGPARKGRSYTPPKRRRTVKLKVLSAKVDDETDWHLTLYFTLTGYGVKDAIVHAATGYLSMGPYPKRLNLQEVRTLASTVPFLRDQYKKPISVQVDPAFLELVEQSAAEEQVSKSAWVESALKAMFSHLRLPLPRREGTEAQSSGSQ
ncbi:hypothetical protein ABZ470_39800 [Streptosporangium sp. NPDC020072]|uniref:hypothetical protein n=1 Tax=Streptosporangium sp. NPDC020072 TaxID=3154788 RepID=UPI003446F929